MAIVLARWLTRAPGARDESRSLLQLAGLAEIGSALVLFWHPMVVRTPAPYDAVVRPAALGLILLSGMLVLWAYRRLGPYWDAAISVRRDHRVVDDGPFALVRHPVYLGLVGFLSGGALLTADPLVALVAAVVAVLVVLRARAEERFLEERLGEAYREYERRVPMLVPRLRR